mmetsp:Transcript_20129/g.43806  ORF Transcript_20129/g.43806 Transcript_20129/m.43806 type:complete len:261 (-) Transcript_20129:293-1075(-)
MRRNHPNCFWDSKRFRGSAIAFLFRGRVFRTSWPCAGCSTTFQDLCHLLFCIERVRYNCLLSPCTATRPRTSPPIVGLGCSTRYRARSIYPPRPDRAVARLFGSGAGCSTTPRDFSRLPCVFAERCNRLLFLCTAGEARTCSPIAEPEYPTRLQLRSTCLPDLDRVVRSTGFVAGCSTTLQDFSHLLGAFEEHCSGPLSLCTALDASTYLPIYPTQNRVPSVAFRDRRREYPFCVTLAVDSPKPRALDRIYSRSLEPVSN